MKKIIILILILISFPAISQNTLSNELYISSGYNMPYTPEYFSDFWFNGFNLNLGFNYPINDYLILQAEFGVNSFLFDEVKYRKRLVEYIDEPGLDENLFIISGGMKQLYLFSLGAKVPLKNIISEKFYPYFVGGGGLTNNKTNDLIIMGSRVKFKTETIIHLYSGGGFNYIFSDKLTFFVDGSYYFAMTKNKYTGPELANEKRFSVDLTGSYKEKELAYLYFRFGIVYTLPD